MWPSELSVKLLDDKIAPKKKKQNKTKTASLIIETQEWCEDPHAKLEVEAA